MVVLKSLHDRRRDAHMSTATMFPVEHGMFRAGRNDTDMRVNGQPERWLVAARLSRMTKRDRERGDELINGIQTQDRRSAEWAQSEGHVIVHVTRDRNISGAIPPWERPELGPWLTDPLKLVQYDGIVAYDIQRLSRGGNYDVSWLRRWAEEHGKKLYVVKERLRWPNRRDGMIWALEAERAEQDLLDMTEKITRELDALTEAGKLVGKPPFGYEITGLKYDKSLVPTDTGRKYVPLIFARVIDGWSGKRIAAWLRDEGVLRENSPFWQNSIGQVIRNPVYKGFRCKYEIIPPDEVELVISGEVVRQSWTGPSKKIIRYRYGRKWREYPRCRYGKVIHKCEALVDAAVWKAANEALENRTHKGFIDPENAAMLSDVLYCPVCAATDAPMYRLTAKGRNTTGKTYSYYRCAGRTGPGKRASCGLLVNMEAVDEAVNLIMARRFDVEIMEHKIIYGNEAQIENELERIRFEIRQLATLDLSDEEYDARLAALRAERDEVAATSVVEDDVQLAGTGQTYLEVWESLPVPQRGRWLAEQGFKVFASKTEVRVVKGERYGVQPIEGMKSRRRRSAA
jgi:DNA invertase Pin-like site-specific DNA recombinase